MFSSFISRVEQLEKQQSENLERFKVRTKELKSSVSKELQEATLDAAGTFVNCYFYVYFCPFFQAAYNFRSSLLNLLQSVSVYIFLLLYSLAIAQVCVG